MNTNINSPIFWQQVKYEFERSTKQYLCHSSEEFKDCFDDTFIREKIFFFAEDFLSNHERWRMVFLHCPNSLFHHELDDEYLYYRAVRLDFLDYMINRTRNG